MEESTAAFDAVSSPLRRGYFLIAADTITGQQLFPAQAGVFPASVRLDQPARALPRSGGGISGYLISGWVHKDSSPLRRGYFPLHNHPQQMAVLFPAQAGVFPVASGIAAVGGTLPRSGGGISIPDACKSITDSSSPLRRGYFQKAQQVPWKHRLFPAQAGVFPFRPLACWRRESLPRSGGGISCHPLRRYHTGCSSPLRRGYFLESKLSEATTASSPLRRGYFLLTPPCGTSGGLFPAQAGVFPVLILKVNLTPTLPRSGGGISSK